MPPASTPPAQASSASPYRKRQRIDGDRFIPMRSGEDLHANFSLIHHGDSSGTASAGLPSSHRSIPNGELNFQQNEEAQHTFSTLLRAELFDSDIPNLPTDQPFLPSPARPHDKTRSRTPPNPPTNAAPASSSHRSRASSSLTPSTPNKNLFSYISPRHYSPSHYYAHAHILTPSRTPREAIVRDFDTAGLGPSDPNSTAAPNNASSDSASNANRTPDSAGSNSTSTSTSDLPSASSNNSRPTSNNSATTLASSVSTAVSASASSPRYSYASNSLPLSAASTPRRRRIPPRGAPVLNTQAQIYSTSPVRLSSQRLLLQPRRQPRAVCKVPYKVLDAPDLADDFYLNLVDWGSCNMLAVGLGSSVYLWNAATGRVNRLCSLSASADGSRPPGSPANPLDDTVTSVSWIQKGCHLAVGTSRGLVQIWDVKGCRRLRTMTGHTSRVGALAWNNHVLTSGGRDRYIFHRDVRSPDQYIRRLNAHKQEVCGLRWNAADGQLASGGNDNKLMIWDRLSDTPLWKFSDHQAAVKAISWSPHQHHLLASGGGTADRRIVFHDTLRGVTLSHIDTGSQVCNLAWSKTSNEIVSTHGYSQNQIVVWKYPSMTQVASLTGHTYRVLYLAMSPDGRVVVTGAGDETLRFWSMFDRPPRSDLDASRLADWAVIR